MDNTAIFSAMQLDKPIKSYKKTILGKVFIWAWDNILDVPAEKIMSGDPRKNEEDSIIDVWSAKEDLYFTRMNKLHLQRGTIVPYTRVELERVKTVDESTDEELLKIVNSKFISLQHSLNKMKEVETLYRVLDLAKGADKSNSIINAIEARLSELQKSPDSTEE